MKKQIIPFFKKFAALPIFFLASATQVLADLLPPGTRPEDTAGEELRPLVVRYINYFLGIVGLIAVAFIIYAGVLLITAGGEEQKITQGKKIITYAVIGIIVIVFSWTIVNFVVGAGRTAPTG